MLASGWLLIRTLGSYITYEAAMASIALRDDFLKLKTFENGRVPAFLERLQDPVIMTEVTGDVLYAQLPPSAAGKPL